MLKSLLCFLLLVFAYVVSPAQNIQKIGTGIWKITYGKPEQHLPSTFKAAAMTEELQTINANDAIVAEAMANIDAEYEALVAEAALVSA